MADLTLWHVPQSRSMRSLWLLHEIGVDFHVEILDFFDGSMRGPRYGAITPVGRVPALQDGALAPGYAGIRPKIHGASAPAADFVIQGPAVHGIPGLVNLFGIESPGLTSALAIAEHVSALV